MESVEQFKEDFYNVSLQRRYHNALTLVKEALSGDIPPQDLVTAGIAETLKEFQRFTDEGYERVSAFQLLAMGKIAEDAIELIKPHLEKDIDEEKQDVVVLGTIKSDFHALGKKILKLFLEMNNFRVVDLGLDVEPKKFIEAVEENDAKYVFVSTMMLHNIIGIKRVGDLLKQKNLNSKVKFFVGGAPFNYNYNLVQKVGADDSAENVTELMDKLLGTGGNTHLEEKTEEKSHFKKILRFFRRK